MPFRQFIQDGAFDPETIEIMSAAYLGACKALNLVDRDDPITEVVAKRILALAQRGERNPDRMCAEALKVLGRAG
jgi:hypothetical protein